jgi:hypothetical protein
MKYFKKFNEKNNSDLAYELYSLLEKSIEVGDNLQDKLSKLSNTDPLAKKLLAFFKSNDIKDSSKVTKVDYDKNDGKLFKAVVPNERDNNKTVTSKIGKLLKQLGYDINGIKGYEMDNFISNFIKSDISNLREVKGDDILHSYNCKNYDSGRSPTMGSCMADSNKQHFLEIYTSNPKQVSCLTLYNPDNDKVRGRALIWNTDDGGRFMDRIYTVDSEDESKFIKYSEENNISRSLNSDVTLENGGEFDYYPYMDTFQYYTPDDDTLSPSDGDLYLISQNGGHADGGDEDDDDEYQGESVFSKVYNEDILENEAVYSDYMEDWIYISDVYFVYDFDNDKFVILNTENDEIKPIYRDYEEGVKELRKKKNSNNYENSEIASNTLRHLNSEKIDMLGLKSQLIYIENSDDAYKGPNYIPKKLTDLYVTDSNGKHYFSYGVVSNLQITAIKDYYGEYKTLDKISYLWSDNQNDKIVVDINDFDKLKNDGLVEGNIEDYLILDNFDVKTESNVPFYIPSKYIKEGVFVENAPFYKVIKLSGSKNHQKIELVSDKQKIHKGLYMSPNDISKCVKTTSGYKKFTPCFSPSFGKPIHKNRVDALLEKYPFYYDVEKIVNRENKTYNGLVNDVNDVKKILEDNNITNFNKPESFSGFETILYDLTHKYINEFNMFNTCYNNGLVLEKSILDSYRDKQLYLNEYYSKTNGADDKELIDGIEKILESPSMYTDYFKKNLSDGISFYGLYYKTNNNSFNVYPFLSNKESLYGVYDINNKEMLTMDIEKIKKLDL